MIEIKDLLSRFREILFSEEIKKTYIVDAVRSVVKIEIKEDQVEIKNGVIYLNIKPIYKNEIALHEEELFLKLAESFGKKTPKSIR